MNHDLFVKTSVRTFHAKICAYASLVNETHCFLKQLTLQSRHLISSFTSWEMNLWSWHHWHHKVFCAYHEWMGFNIVWSQFISKISSCVSHRRNSHRFGTTWGWVAKWGQPLFGWSVPLKTHISHSDRCLFNVVLKKPTSPWMTADWRPWGDDSLCIIWNNHDSFPPHHHVLLWAAHQRTLIHQRVCQGQKHLKQRRLLTWRTI